MSSNSLIIKNTVFLITRTLITSLVGLFAVRELLRILGADAYGLFNLVFGVAILFTFINEAMTVSSQRYLSFYLGKGDESLLRKAWNSSVFLHLFLAITISLLLLIFRKTLIFNFLEIEEDLLSSAVLIYYAAIVSIFLSILQSPLSALVLAHEDMSFYAWISLSKAVMNLLTIYILTFFIGSKLEVYTVLYVLTTFLILVIYILFCFYRYKPVIDKKSFKLALTKEMFFYSSWNMYGNFANVAKSQGINIVLNIFFGVVVNAAYAITNNVISVVSGLTNSVLTSIRPQIYKSYAAKDTKRNFELLSYGSKYSYFFSLFLISPILLNVSFLINLWLVDPPPSTIQFIKLAFITTLINSLSGPLMAGIQATGKIKAYQLTVGLVVFLNLPISYGLLRLYKDPTVPFIVAIVIAVITLYLRLFFLRKQTGYRIYTFLTLVIRPILLVTSIVLLSSLLMNKYISFSNSYIQFIAKCSLITFTNILAVILTGLNRDEKIKVKNLILRIFK